MAGKGTALVIGIPLFFSKMLSSFWLLETQCFQLTECQPWTLDMFLEQKWGQWGAEDHSCPHYVLLQGWIVPHNNGLASLYYITQDPDGVFPTLPSSTNPLFTEELAKHRDGPFLSSIRASAPRRMKLHQIWKEEQNNWYRQLSNRDVLRTFADGFYRKSWLVFMTVIKVVIECFILWLHQSIFLFKHSIVLMLYFQFQGCIFIWSQWDCILEMQKSLPESAN